MLNSLSCRKNAQGGQFVINGIQSPNTSPLIFGYSETGTYTINGTYTQGTESESASVIVKVVDGAFPEEQPACLSGVYRTWTCGELPAEAVIEVDNTVELTEVDALSRVFSIKSTDIYSPQRSHRKTGTRGSDFR